MAIVVCSAGRVMGPNPTLSVLLLSGLRIADLLRPSRADFSPCSMCEIGASQLRECYSRGTVTFFFSFIHCSSHMLLTNCPLNNRRANFTHCDGSKHPVLKECDGVSVNCSHLKKVNQMLILSSYFGLICLFQKKPSTIVSRNIVFLQQQQYLHAYCRCIWWENQTGKYALRCQIHFYPLLLSKTVNQ